VLVVPSWAYGRHHYPSTIQLHIGVLCAIVTQNQLQNECVTSWFASSNFPPACLRHCLVRPTRQHPTSLITTKPSGVGDRRIVKVKSMTFETMSYSSINLEVIISFNKCQGSNEIKARSIGRYSVSLITLHHQSHSLGPSKTPAVSAM
jgi:hypothetical protein